VGVNDAFIDEPTARRLAAAPKSASHPLVWRPNRNHFGHLVCVTPVLSDTPGLTVEFSVRAPALVQACMYKFTLFRLAHGQRLRAYMLEVAPHEKKTHNGPEGSLYGPHEHYGGAAFAIDDASVHCRDWEACLEHFLRRCPVADLQVDPPPPC
jgi:hypothetical protein